MAKKTKKRSKRKALNLDKVGTDLQSEIDVIRDTASELVEALEGSKALKGIVAAAKRIDKLAESLHGYAVELESEVAELVADDDDEYDDDEYDDDEYDDDDD